MNKLLLPLFSLYFVGCVSNSAPDTKFVEANLRKPSVAAKVYKPKGEWDIRSEKDLEPVKKLGAKVVVRKGVTRVNLNGIVLDGSSQNGSGSQSEDQTPIFRARIPLVIENGFINNNKNAATFYKQNSGVRNIVWTEIGEDAVATYDGAKNFFVDGCEFSGAADKSIQLNEASGARVVNNTIVGGITGARIGKIDFSSSKDVAICGNNTFINVDTAWNVGKVTLIVGENKNIYKNVKTPFKTTHGAKIKNADEKVVFE